MEDENRSLQDVQEKIMKKTILSQKDDREEDQFHS